jgi:hypothetical protein
MTPDMHAAILQPRCPMVQTGPDENGRKGVGAEVHTMESSTTASGVLNFNSMLPGLEGAIARASAPHC